MIPTESARPGTRLLLPIGRWSWKPIPIPNVPPLPPHITLKQAKNFVSMIPADPELGSVLINSAKELLTSILPGRR